MQGWQDNKSSLPHILQYVICALAFMLLATGEIIVCIAGAPQHSTQQSAGDHLGPDLHRGMSLLCCTNIHRCTAAGQNSQQRQQSTLQLTLHSGDTHTTGVFGTVWWSYQCSPEQ